MISRTVETSTIRSSAILLGVPIKTQCNRMFVDSERFLARSTVMVHDKMDQKNYFFAGASVDKSPELASHISRLEVIERVFATPFLNRGRSTFDVFDCLTDGRRGDIPAHRILINDKPSIDDEAMSNADPNAKGAVGLGLGSDLGQAKQHGLFEAIERHLRSTIWYRERPVREIGSSRYLLEGRYLLRQFTAGDIDVPFCLSVVSAASADESVFFVGSSLKENFLKASRKADNEVLMMLESYLQRYRGLANTLDSRQRFLRLQGSEAMRASDFFQTRVQPSGTGRACKTMEERSICEAVLGVEPDIRYAVLMSKNGLILVRAFSSHLTWERRERALRPDWPVADPFC